MAEKMSGVQVRLLQRRVDAWLDTRFERRREFNRRALQVRARAAHATGEDAARVFYPRLALEKTDDR